LSIGVLIRVMILRAQAMLPDLGGMFFGIGHFY
jgi:hypothetical protein